MKKNNINSLKCAEVIFGSLHTIDLDLFSVCLSVEKAPDCSTASPAEVKWCHRGCDEEKNTLKAAANQ